MALQPHTGIVLNYTWYRGRACAGAPQVVNFHSLGRNGLRPPRPARPRHAAAAIMPKSEPRLRGLRRCRSLANHVGQVVDAAHEVVGEGGAQVALQRLDGALARQQRLAVGKGERTMQSVGRRCGNVDGREGTADALRPKRMRGGI